MSGRPVVVRRDDGADYDVGDPSRIRVRLTADDSDGLLTVFEVSGDDDPVLGLGPGSLIFVPPGIPHGLAPSDPWRHLTLVLPGGFDRYFAEVAAMLAAGGGAHDRSAVATRYGTYPVAPG